VSGTDAPTHISITAGPLVGPVLRRVVGMVAARADMPLDRLDDAVLIADIVAERVPAYSSGGRVEVELSAGHRELTLRVGPVRPGDGAAVVEGAAVPGVGNVIEQLADSIEVDSGADADFLVVRLAYAGAT
jgi:serine/threonine-protein kinase RsbW